MKERRIQYIRLASRHTSPTTVRPGGDKAAPHKQKASDGKDEAGSLRVSERTRSERLDRAGMRPVAKKTSPSHGQLNVVASVFR
mmetsp:Transcript_7206/g.14203  ORF Transcript_7206/g.14203 Transcript_7206/m.14203 type:complete len:84 (+) Transcript_7206:2722-2973(+)